MHRARLQIYRRFSRWHGHSVSLRLPSREQTQETGSGRTLPSAALGTLHAHRFWAAPLIIGDCAKRTGMARGPGRPSAAWSFSPSWEAGHLALSMKALHGLNSLIQLPGHHSAEARPVSSTFHYWRPWLHLANCFCNALPHQECTQRILTAVLQRGLILGPSWLPLESQLPLEDCCSSPGIRTAWRLVHARHTWV